MVNVKRFCLITAGRASEVCLLKNLKSSALPERVFKLFGVGHIESSVRAPSDVEAGRRRAEERHEEPTGVVRSANGSFNIEWFIITVIPGGLPVHRSDFSDAPVVSRQKFSVNGFLENFLPRLKNQTSVDAEGRRATIFSAMAGTNSDYLENKVVDHVCGTSSFTMPATVVVALFTVDPNFETGAGGTEATGGSYVRKAVAFTAASAGANSNTGALTWTVGTDIAAGTYTGWGVYDATSNGNLLFGDAFSVSKTLSVAGDTLTFAIGAITYSTT